MSQSVYYSTPPRQSPVKMPESDPMTTPPQRRRELFSIGKFVDENCYKPGSPCSQEERNWAGDNEEDEKPGDLAEVVEENDARKPYKRIKRSEKANILDHGINEKVEVDAWYESRDEDVVPTQQSDLSTDTCSFAVEEPKSVLCKCGAVSNLAVPTCQKDHVHTQTETVIDKMTEAQQPSQPTVTYVCKSVQTDCLKEAGTDCRINGEEKPNHVLKDWERICRPRVKSLVSYGLLFGLFLAFIW